MVNIKIDQASAAVVNTEVAGSIEPLLIECLFYGVMDGKYQICKSLDNKIVFIFENPKDALKYKMSSMEEKLSDIKKRGDIGSAFRQGPNTYQMNNPVHYTPPGILYGVSSVPTIKTGGIGGIAGTTIC